MGNSEVKRPFYAAPPRSVPVVTEEMVKAAIDAYDDVLAGRNPEMNPIRAALNAALASASTPPALTLRNAGVNLLDRAESAEAQLAQVREALNVAEMALTDIAEFHPSGESQTVFQQIASHARATTLEALTAIRRARSQSQGASSNG